MTECFLDRGVRVRHVLTLDAGSPLAPEQRGLQLHTGRKATAHNQHAQRHYRRTPDV